MKQLGDTITYDTVNGSREGIIVRDLGEGFYIIKDGVIMMLLWEGLEYAEIKEK